MPLLRFELTTFRVTARCSTTELLLLMIFDVLFFKLYQRFGGTVVLYLQKSIAAPGGQISHGFAIKIAIIIGSIRSNISPKNMTHYLNIMHYSNLYCLMTYCIPIKVFSKAVLHTLLVKKAISKHYWKCTIIIYFIQYIFVAYIFCTSRVL